MFKVVRKVFVVVCIVVGLLGLVVQVVELKIGFKVEIILVDFYVFNSVNCNIWVYVYDLLVVQDYQLCFKFGLVLLWCMFNLIIWEFRLWLDVKFYDGQIMMVEDVKYLIECVMNFLGLCIFCFYLCEVSVISVSVFLIVQVKIKYVSLMLLDNFGFIVILFRFLGEYVSEESFVNGKLVIGIGLYCFGSWLYGQKFVFIKNLMYWGEKEFWDIVSFQFILCELVCVVVLLLGLLDIINDIIVNMEILLCVFKLVLVMFYMFNYFVLDQFCDSLFFVCDVSGVFLKKNFMKDFKVCQVMMMVINCDGIIKYFMKDDVMVVL